MPYFNYVEFGTIKLPASDSLFPTKVYDNISIFIKGVRIPLYYTQQRY